MPDQKPGLQPLPLTPTNPVAAQAPVRAAAPDAPSLDEKVDAWLDDHPADKPFETQASTETPQTAPTEAVAPGDAVAPGTAATPPGEADKPAPPTEPQAKVETPPPPSEPQPQAQQQPQAEAKPAAPAEPIRFSLDAKYVFAEGTQPWTGQQVWDALRERQVLIPKAQEAEQYAEVFQMPAAQAKELWEPNLQWLRGNPSQVGMIASLMADQQKAQYILQCSDYYDTTGAVQQQPQSGGQPTEQQYQPQQPRMSSEVEARFNALEAQNKQLVEAEKARQMAVYTNRISRDMNIAFERYPYLKDSPQMQQALLARAWWLAGTDDSKGVLDALDMEKDLYDAKLFALNGATQIAREAAAPTTPVPPLMGSTGASPQASAPRTAQPKKFAQLDDAVDEWISNPPAQFR